MKQDIPILNFDDRGTRDLAVAHIKSLRGLYRFNCLRCRNQRSLLQNAYYFGVCLSLLAPVLAEAWGDPLFTVDKAHEFFKGKYLTQPVVNRKTGELQGFVCLSTTELDTLEFSYYIDKICEFAAENFQMTIPPPTKYRMAEEKPT